VDSGARWLQKGTFLFFAPIRWYFGMSAIGTEQIPTRGPVLIAPNHASFADPWFVTGWVPRNPVRFLVNDAWYYRSRLLKQILDWNAVIPQSRRPIETIGRVVRALNADAAVAVFPEGRVTFDGKMTRTQHGIGWIAALSGAPVVPCGLQGNFEAWPRQRIIPRRGQIRVAFGTPMYFASEPCLQPDPEQVHQFTCRLVGEIAKLAGQSDRLAEILPETPIADLRGALLRRQASLALPQKNRSSQALSGNQG
jgi:1-acyl-sn-glycerol-3-phosphate acyltransferase